MTEIEEWRTVTHNPGYEVSNQGRVRSVDRTVRASNGRNRRLKGKLLRPRLSGTPYPKVNLSDHGAERNFYVHELVAAAFLGPRPIGMQICHNDGDALNNHAWNLRYDTVSENLRDQVRHGTHAWAGKTHCVNGHPFTPENTKRAGGQRVCRTCRRKTAREWARKHRAQHREKE